MGWVVPQRRVVFGVFKRRGRLGARAGYWGIMFCRGNGVGVARVRACGRLQIFDRGKEGIDVVMRQDDAVATVKMKVVVPMAVERECGCRGRGVRRRHRLCVDGLRRRSRGRRIRTRRGDMVRMVALAVGIADPGRRGGSVQTGRLFAEV